jgi:hypothetical protein
MLLVEPKNQSLRQLQHKDWWTQSEHEDQET